MRLKATTPEAVVMATVAEPVAIRINAANSQPITSGDSYRVIPWQMGVVAKLMRLLPNPVFDRLLAGRGRKKRRGEMD